MPPTLEPIAEFRDHFTVISGLDLPAHTEARWIRFPVIREHTNDGRIVIHATATAGPNLMLTDLAFVPEE